MTTDDEIRDEKLRYNINREAAKISELLSGKIDKNQYFAGEEILPPEQYRMIGQDKFTQSPFGKVFEKHIKIKALEEYQKVLIKSNNEKDSLFLLKQKEIFDEIINKRMGEIRKFSEEIDFDNLIYYFKNKNNPKNFAGFKSPLALKISGMFIQK